MKPLTSNSGGAPTGASPLARDAANRRMQRIATSMLLVMAAIFFTARAFEDQHPAIGYIRAFAEAAMVGGLADWFAVTALFRHPMGLPIPHTAIIPRNKDRIGNALANFLRANFLQPRIVARRMMRMDLAHAVGNFLKAPRGSEGRLRLGASRLISDVVGSLDSDRLGKGFKGAVRQRVEALDVATPLGQILEAVMAENRHGPLIDSTIRWAYRTLDANEGVIRALVSDRTNAILRWTGIDDRLANEVIDGLYKLLGDMAADTAHPLRARTEEGLQRLARDLRHDEALRARIEAWKHEMIANPTIGEWIDGIWEQARSGLRNTLRDPDTALAGHLGQTLVDLGSSMQSDARLNRQINRFARRAISGTVSTYGDTIVRLVSDTIHGWDAKTITDRVENAVGRDLQYIRINGTLVGGLVGLTLHAIGQWFY